MTFRFSGWRVAQGMLVLLALLGFGNVVWAGIASALLTSQVELVTLTYTNEQGEGDSAYPAPSANGEWVVFWSRAENMVPNDGNAVGDVFVRNVGTGSTEQISVAPDGTTGNGESGSGADASRQVISADGRYITFISRATNLIPSDANGTGVDVFRHDRQTQTTLLVSQSSGGVQGGGDRC